LALQHLLGQVVEHIAVAAREGLYEGVNVELALKRQSGQLQPSDPAFGAFPQRGKGHLGHFRPHRSPQHRGGLSRGEAQVGGAELGQLPAGPQPGQRQRRVGPAGQHQPERRWQVLQQILEGGVDRLGLDQMVVIHDQHDPLGHPGQLVDQRGDHRVERG
jgi:hypothetical protein